MPKKKMGRRWDVECATGCPRVRGGVLLLNAYTSRGVTACTFLALVALRTAWCVHFVAGALLNAAWGKFLKYCVFRQRRPATAGTLQTPGMPSSHSQSLSYFATSLSCAAVWSCAQGRTTASAAAGVALATFGYALLVGFARVHLTKVHTIPQVAVGFLCGGSFAASWWWWVLCDCTAADDWFQSRTLCGVLGQKLL